MIHLVIALAAEARPVIERFGLSQSGALRCWESERMRLVISGVGREAATAATARLHEVGGSQSDLPWINYGIAGHPERALGEPVLANQIRDPEGGRSLYPLLTFALPCGVDVLQTVDEPEVDYNEPVLYDMEGSAFWRTASRFSTAELVHVLKVVSDNRRSGLQGITRDRVGELAAGGLEVLESLCVRLSELARFAASEKIYPCD